MATKTPRRKPTAEAIERPVFGPCSEKQRQILLDDETDILLCGGGAGGGKSHTCLTKALKFINDPAARVLIIRRSYPTLKLPGGLVDESKGIYSHFGGEFKVQELKWEFPNGASIKFMAIPDNLAEWQGLQASHMLVDEAAEFKEEEILFLLSRLRSAKYKGHLSVTMTCNPSRESFLYNWIEYSLDPETGIPKEGTEEIVRYVINVNGKTYWENSIEELWDKYGEKLYLVREAEDPDDVTFLPKSFRFIPLTIHDNPILKRNNPGYLAGLLAQPRVNQLRFLHGSWTARAEGSGYFRREWVKIIEPHEVPLNVVGRVRSWDLAASKPSETNRDPDYTAGVKLSRDKFGYYYVEDVNRFREMSDDVVKEIIRTAHHDGLPPEVAVTIPKDPGAGGTAANKFHVTTFAENGVAVKSIPISGHTGKIARFLPFATIAQAGMVRVVRGPWLEDFLTELEYFEGLRTQKDDQVDAVADAFNTLSRQVQLPTFALPSMQMASPVPRLPS